MLILEKLFCGKVQPYSNLNVFDSDYKPITNKIREELKWLKSKLTEDEYERFEKLEYFYLEYASLHQKKSFLYSFKLGSLLMLELLTGNDDLFKEFETE